MLEVATRVRSVPARLISAAPKGMRKSSSSGTGPESLYIILSSKKSTGLSSRIAVLSRPLASRGVAGMATLSPGMWAKSACKLCECCAAEERPAPIDSRIVSGTLHWPPDM